MAPFVVDDHVPVLEPARLVASTEDLDPRLRSPHLLEGRRIVDFSSLWAGPLAASLLAQAGADVVKVESTTRPDGARSGEPRFFALVNARKRSVAVDFTAPAAAEQLAALIDGAAMVLEASRPRAFEQLGLDPTDWRRRHPAGTWVSITAHGRTGPGRQWSGFGDDAAVAGGLVIEVPGKAPLLCADAYADPATGLHAAAVAAAGLVGVGGSFDVALREVVNHLLAEHTDGGANDEAADAADVRVAAPRARASLGPAPRLGADNAAVLGPMRPTSGGSRQTTTPPTPILERP